MKNIWEKHFQKMKQQFEIPEGNSSRYDRRVAALYDVLRDLYGTDKLVLKAGKLGALNLLRSNDLNRQVLALQKIVFEDPTLDRLPQEDEIPEIIEKIEEKVADVIARRAVEDQLEKKVAERMQQRHEEYLREIKIQVLKENTNPENAQTLKRLATLEKLEQTQLAKTPMEILRPQRLEEIVGQERPLKALVSKLASPYPQHIILYGPPGVGKTTAARLALEVAKKLNTSAFTADAPFVEVNGATLRWDPREVTNPLLGSVHDPIYQGARRELAETGVPEPKLGLVTEAHGGILFIDEIGEMDPLLLNKLLKVLEDKRVTFDSSYYDPSDENIPQYIRKIFEEGAPADFILIGATTRSPHELNPALRSRCAEIYFEPLSPEDIQQIVRSSAEKLGVKLEPAVPEIISKYTIEGRKANNILADAYAMALYKRTAGNKTKRRKKVIITVEDIYEVIQTSRLVPYVVKAASSAREIGSILALGVAGYVGSVLEIEAVAFPVEPGKGKVRFNQTAGKMAQDSVFNAAAVFRKLVGERLDNYDLHVNVVGGGNIDGPSAGLAIVLAIISAVQQKPLLQNIAVTGEISIQGKVKPVGGIFEKLYGARQAGVKKVLIPKENEKDVPAQLKEMEVIPVATVEEALPHVF
ncbi:Lon family ATP-dependent protease [Calderihabitans maritimus]|uniref:endopeptidase La n=1 Tax=Calderihabitans maritimus TaxID=1246530 RepID=A0A1Z5HWL9_9FIRM|nr:ATP-dependent protease [Calderihabitans maritimus]